MTLGRILQTAGLAGLILFSAGGLIAFFVLRRKGRKLLKVIEEEYQ